MISLNKSIMIVRGLSLARISAKLIKNSNQTSCKNLNLINLTNVRLITTEQQQQQQQQSANENSYEKFDEDYVKNKVLENALKFIPQFGFTTEALTNGAVAAGLSSASVNGIFKNGEFDLIDYFYKKCNNDLSNYLENLIKEEKIKKKNELIREALIYRLSLIQPYINHWPKAMAIQSFYPFNAVKSIENLVRLCDEIWYQAGDKSTDVNIKAHIMESFFSSKIRLIFNNQKYSWYTKRLTLAAIYKSTELFMIQDKSENFKETAEFLDRRFEDLANISKLTNEVNNVNQAVVGTFAVLRNILNLRN